MTSSVIPVICGTIQNVAMSMTPFTMHTNSSCSWICCGCGLPNFSSSLFDSFSISTQNYYHSLSSPSETSTLPSVLNTNNGFATLNSPKAEPIPQSSSTPTRQQPSLRSNQIKVRKLKIMTINCCSLQSLDKKLQFQELITEHNPDIICGTESHLNADYYTAEVFPPDFNITRKERPVAGGGVVFICS